MKYWSNLRFGQNSKLYLVVLILLIEVILILSTNYIKTRPIIRRWSYLVSDISCHYEEKEDALPSAEGPSFSPKTRSIFFHETSCKGGLNSRQACAVESAARANPESEIYVLFSAPVTERILKRTTLAKLQQFLNVKLARVHIAEYAKGTILETILHDLEDSKYPVEHTSDIFKILTLNKWGGIYLDTDMLVTRSLEKLPPNWMVRQSDGFIPTAILSFAKDDVGSNMTSAILNEIFKSYNPYDWPAYAPRAIQNVVMRMCPNFANSEHCEDFKFYPYELFYPLHYTLWKLYFKEGTFTNFEHPYTYHMWDHLSKYERIEKDSPYEVLAKKYCPSIYAMYGDKFGI